MSQQVDEDGREEGTAQLSTIFIEEGSQGAFPGPAALQAGATSQPLPSFLLY